jgi:CheY-like chemotaxis protein
MSASASAASREVCLIDDDPSVLRSMHYLLAAEGFAVRTFGKAADFLKHVLTHEVAVVVTDIWMTEVTGLEVLARLCAISPKTRVIVITAREDLAARATAMAIGPVAYFMKPFDDTKFIAAVREALAGSAGFSSETAPGRNPPDNVRFHQDVSLLIWQPKGVIDESAVSDIVAYLGELELRREKPFNRLIDGRQADSVELNFRFIFRISLFRRLSYRGPPIQSAIVATDPALIRYAKTHALLTQGSALSIRLFEQPDAAAKWLEVPIDLLT